MKKVALRLAFAFILGGLNVLIVKMVVASQANQCPTARLSASPTTIAPQGTVHFNACSSSDPDGSVVSYWFDYGDGFDSGWVSSCTNDNVYPDAGTYYVKVKVKDNQGCVSAWSSSVQITVVTNQCPTARLSASPTTVQPQQNVTLNACSSSDPDGTVTSYWFDYGDGFDSGWTSSCTNSHAYTDAGTYSVKVKVKDN